MKIVAVVTLAVLSSIQAKHTEQFDVRVDVDKVVTNVGDEFIGVKFSADLLRKYWLEVDTSSKQLQSLAKGLGPSILKIGGTAAQFLIFKPYGHPHNSVTRFTNFTMTGEVWEKMYNFVHKAGWKMMFDFSNLLRKGDKWDDDNANEFLKYSEQKDFSIPYIQLGNEPNAYNYKYHFNYTGARLAKDMQMLRELLSKFPKYKDSKIIGPDVGNVLRSACSRFLEEFLAHGGPKVVSAVGLHQYYLKGKESKVKDMASATTLNLLIKFLDLANEMIKPYDLPIWLTETSSFTGGLDGGSNRYGAGFMWLDKLGLCALYKVKTVLRQTFIGGRYCLIEHDFFPYPDYFLTVLYKRLVKGPIFKVINSKDEIRAYASCTNTDGQYEKGALTVYILNLKDHSVTVNFLDYAGQTYDFYLLEPGDSDGLKSKYVKLNGNKLEMVGEELPKLLPMKTSHIEFPKKTFGFIVIPNAHVKAC